MTNGLIESQLVEISSTYGILTAERILDRFNLTLNHHELLQVMRDPNNVYFQILLVPFKNIINGIILQQVYDYQVYAQKLFVDFLVKGDGNDDPEAPGANIRDDLEQNRLKLVNLGEQFDKDISAHKTLIHQTQAQLLTIVGELAPITEPLEHAQDVAMAMLPFLERTKELGVALSNYRVEFKTLILDTKRLILLLPDYRQNETQAAENLSMLEFDDQLGTSTDTVTTTAIS